MEQAEVTVCCVVPPLAREKGERAPRASECRPGSGAAPSQGSCPLKADFRALAPEPKRAGRGAGRLAVQGVVAVTGPVPGAAESPGSKSRSVGWRKQGVPDGDQTESAGEGSRRKRR